MAAISCTLRPSVRAASAAPRVAANKALKPTAARPVRGATVVRRAMDEKDPFDMSAIGLDDIMQLTEDADSNAQAKWLPGSYAPDYLNGAMVGDFGFDPLGFGKDPAMLAKFREAELIHARWAMLGVAGMLAVEVLGYGNWLEAPIGMTKGEDATYFGVNLGPATFNNTLVVELALMGFAEGQRAKETDATKRCYPGGAFDPMGMSKGDLATLQLKEIKNGRLAMAAVFGIFMQGAVTQEGPVANWAAHISDPWGVNIATSNSVALPFAHADAFGGSFWSAAVPSWYAGL